MKVADINFRSRIGIEQHPRYREFLRLIGSQDFSAYREVFERGWAETSIMCGEFLRLEEYPIVEEEPNGTLLTKLMGVNQHSPRRARLAKEFFGECERLGRRKFLRNGAMRTDYAKDLMAISETRVVRQEGVRALLARAAQRRAIRHRITSFVNIYENMKRFGRLVGKAHILQQNPTSLEPADLPWAIDYCGYIKLRDGAHRRAIAGALGWSTVPTLVFEFDRTSKDTLGSAHPYIRDNFDWFACLVRETAKLECGIRSSQST